MFSKFLFLTQLFIIKLRNLFLGGFVYGGLDQISCHQTENFLCIPSTIFGSASTIAIMSLTDISRFNILFAPLAPAETKYDEAIQQAYKEDKGIFPDAEDFADSVGKVSIIIE